jgi:hypothetical protein
MNYPQALPKLLGQDLENELVNVARAANAHDGMLTFFQALADDPPGTNIPGLVLAFSQGEVRPRARSVQGLPQVSPDERWFAADRPFVNRLELRTHLRELATSAGAKSILVIDGAQRTGKSFTVFLLNEFDVVQDSPPPLDVDAYARVGAQLNARELAVSLLGGDETGCPPMDITKEAEAVPRLTRWLVGRLRERPRAWIVVDHCNRPVLTDGARRVLADFATELHRGTLPKVRLILIDFDRNALPVDWRNNVRHDQAILPSRDHVTMWCKQLATAANREYSDQDPVNWASEVFAGLDEASQQDGSWHAALEQKLRDAVGKIMACRVRT